MDNAARISMLEKWIPVFYGQPDIEVREVHQFIDRCKLVQRMVKGNPLEIKDLIKEIIILRFAGRAYELFREAQIDTFEKFYETITKRFLPLYSLEFLNNRLTTARQGVSETCTEFGERIKNYAFDYEAGVITKYGEGNSLPKPLVISIIKESFIKGLRNQAIKPHIVMAQDKSTEELISMAERLEMSIGPSQIKMEQNNERFQGTNTYECQLCGRSGHNAKMCPTWTQGQNYSQSRRIGFNEFCSSCNRRGHRFEDCRTRPRVLNESSVYQPNYMAGAYRQQSRTFAPRYQQFNQYQSSGQKSQETIGYKPSRQSQFQPSIQAQFEPTMQTKFQEPEKFQTQKHVHFQSPNLVPRSMAIPSNRFESTDRNLEDGIKNLSINYIEAEYNPGNEEVLADLE